MNEADIERLLEKFDQSGLQELKVDGNGVDVYFSKLSNKAESSTSLNTNVSSNQPQVADHTNPNYTVKASMVGLAYFAPSPDKPAYKAIGDHIKQGETICAIEAMKLINEIKSPVTGTIMKRLVNDGDMVEFDQPLFEIKED